MKLIFNFVIMSYLNLEKVAEKDVEGRGSYVLLYYVLNFLLGTILREKA